MENIPLEKNPEPGNKTKVYIKPNPDEAHRSSFGAKLKGWFSLIRIKRKSMRLREKKKIKKA